ncbi:hypothetical protein Ade02nite_58970 [Paractinoplanes deccanensis]|uniref:Transposase IS701-like DDE domain-containing protein n=1 Tax=Paractinoplanes deccanensis TaxID=113561 RepID=A0ABQ3YB78_9ACTN|nr:hypothetical protein Ade02nite_58970 [Actinoplanes deccanensis]
MNAEPLTKPRIAIDMLQRAADANVPFTWFTADEAFGQAKYLRSAMEPYSTTGSGPLVQRISDG